MNVTNKRQRKVNLLASQKIDLRSRKGVKKNKKANQSSKWYLILLFSLTRACKSFIYLTYKTFKKRPKLTYVLSIIFITLIFFKVSIYFVEIYSEKVLPTHVQIDTDSKQVTFDLYRLVNVEIEKAKKNKEKRSDFLIHINEILESVDIIDQYWIRLGLDGKLQISAIMQIPIMLIEAKNNERYVISNNMKIIAKNPTSNQYSSLIKLDAPELKINWKPKNYLTKNKKISKDEPLTNRNDPNAPVNFIWLLSQTKFINSEILKLGTGYTLAKISWDSNTGFTLKIIRNNQLLNIKSIEKNKPEESAQNNQVQDTDTLTALIGENNLKEKLERLRTILKELGNKKIYPSKIDLDFTDKASFKIQGINSKSSW